MHVLRQNHERVELHVVAGAGEHRGRRLVARRLDAKNRGHRRPVSVAALTEPAMRASGGICTSTRTSAGFTRTPFANDFTSSGMRNSPLSRTVTVCSIVRIADTAFTARRGPVTVTLSGTTTVRRRTAGAPESTTTRTAF